MLTKRMPMIRFFTGSANSDNPLVGIPSDTGAGDGMRRDNVNKFYPGVTTYTELGKTVLPMTTEIPSIIHSNFNMAKAFDMMGLPVNTDHELLPQGDMDIGTMCPPTKQAFLKAVLPDMPADVVAEESLEQPNTVGQDILEHLRDYLSGHDNKPFTDTERLFNGLETIPMYE